MIRRLCNLAEFRRPDQAMVDKIKRDPKFRKQLAKDILYIWKETNENDSGSVFEAFGDIFKAVGLKEKEGYERDYEA